MSAFAFDLTKSIQAVGVLFRADDTCRMSYLRLLKVLYMADRSSFEQTKRPIIGGEVYAMPHGPVLQEVYDLVKGKHRGMDIWSRYFRRKRFDLEMLRGPDVGQLSQHELDTLQAVAKKYKDYNEWEMVEETHKLSEYMKNDPGKSSKLIPERDILEETGHADEADAIIKYESEISSVKQILAARQKRRLLERA